MSSSSCKSVPRCNLVWGPSAAARAAEAGEVIVIVDTLSFSTATAVAVGSGGVIYPCVTADEVEETARRIGGERAVARGDVPHRGRYSLSPMTFFQVERGSRIVLRSVNGGACTRASAGAPAVFTGAIVNAAAVAVAVRIRARQEPDRGVTVVACGERDDSLEDMPIRFAVEDLLGAGAIIAGLDLSKTPSARAAEAAFLHLRSELAWALGESASGEELTERGFDEDVRFSAQLDFCPFVPVLRGEHYVLLR